MRTLIVENAETRARELAADPTGAARGLDGMGVDSIVEPHEHLVGRVRRLLERRVSQKRKRANVGEELTVAEKGLATSSEREQIVDFVVSACEEVLQVRQREYNQKVAEESQQRSRRLLQSTLDAVSARIAIVDLMGRIVAVNVAWSRMAEASGCFLSASGVGQDYRTVLEAAFGRETEHVRRSIEGLEELRSGRAPYFQFEYAERGNGELRWIALSATRFEVNGLDLVAIESEDITERKRAAQLEEQLRQFQKLEAIGQLAGGVAHDFNNLLCVIISYAEFVFGNLSEADRGREDLAELLGAAKRGASLTRQLLAFSRQQVVQPVVVELNTVVRSVESMLRRVIGENIQLVTLLDPTLGRLKADPTQIEQVLLNLSVNARDALPKGGKVTIGTANVVLDEAYSRAHAGVQAGHFVLLAVHDSGVGMDTETQARIFEPFFTTKEIGKGTGLGLSTVYGIVRQSGGHITVHSTPGRGTTFNVYFPMVNEPVRAEVEARTTPSESHAPGRVLVVEDEDTVRRVAVRILEESGYGTLEAKTAAEARVLCNELGDEIDLLLTDVVMPETTGPELAAELLPTSPSLRILYMSGYPRRAATQEELLSPGMPFLEKPFSPDSLVRRVREVLEAESREAPAVNAEAESPRDLRPRGPAGERSPD